ncbi:MAG: hypothetical protein K1562_13365 [Candidatus Thiodiazotropha sp. (ex. Lucinisca nassula)]|nr:hypothetical protein [Candidatus Thiodiazotropha sp. (ex. Lucinisca nassula)]
MGKATIATTKSTGLLSRAVLGFHYLILRDPFIGIAAFITLIVGSMWVGSEIFDLYREMLPKAWHPFTGSPFGEGQ